MLEKEMAAKLHAARIRVDIDYPKMSRKICSHVKSEQERAFLAGIEFANEWYSSKRKDTPVNKILLCKVEDFYIIAFFDGNKWVNDSSLEVEKVTHWRPIF